MTRDLSSIPRSHRKLLSSELKQVTARRRELVEASVEDLLPLAAAHRATSVEIAASGSWLVEPVALAAVAAERVLGMSPFDVQILAALAIGHGALAEVRTGEGKTLIATMPAAAWALAGQHVHIMTANPYLAERDAAWMRPVYEALGLSVGFVDDHPSIWRRKQAYACDIVYGTAAQFGFDYLNDHLVKDGSHRAQLRREVAIVDEADALLLDDARTPLIISGPATETGELSRVAAFVASLDPSCVDVERDSRVAMLNEAGFDAAEAFFDTADLTADVRLMADLYAALRARFCYERDKEYLVRDGKVLIVDESTGRVQSDRRWQHGLHEALEAKEGLEVFAPPATLGSITIPSLLAMYDRVGAMTGTAMSDKAEFNDTYGLHVFAIPTNHPVRRLDADDVLFATADAKFAALAAEIGARTATGQPVLVGAPTVADAEEISRRLHDLSIPHELLSARDPARESEIIAQAGRPSAVTVATNMAGRGVDILLGGDPARLAMSTGTDLVLVKASCSADRERVIAAGGLAVLATARHASRRVDDQLRGRAGRQGEPGFSKFFLSLDDDLLSFFASDTIRALVARAAHDPGEPISHKMVSRLLASAQDKVESLHREARRGTNQFAAALSAQRSTVYEWRDGLLDLDEESGVATMLAPGFRLALADLAAVHGSLSAVADSEIANALAFGADSTPDWVDDELIAALRAADLSDLDTLVPAARRCVAAFVSRNLPVSSSLDEADLHVMLRTIALTKLDQGWIEHLAALDSLRDSVSLRSAGNLKPTTEYVFESSKLFEEMGRDVLLYIAQVASVGSLRRDTPATAEPSPSEPTSSPGQIEPGGTDHSTTAHA